MKQRSAKISLETHFSSYKQFRFTLETYQHR